MKVETDESVFKLFTYWVDKGFVMRLLFKFWASAVHTMLLIPVLRVN